MTELRNDPPTQEDDKELQEHLSPWMMLTSMLLLIAGLGLSSAMLVHYALERGGIEDAPRFGISHLLEKGKALSALPKATDAGNGTLETSTEEPVAAPGVKRFFSGGSGSVRWPRLKITGFGKSADGEGGFAIINGNHVLVGQTGSKVKLVEIQTHGVVLEYKGEQKILAVNPTQ